MIIDVKVPSPGESISEVQLANWLVEDGSYVEKDQEIAEIDSDKATLSISAEQSGVIRILVSKGNSIEVGSVVARIETDGKAPAAKAKTETPSETPSAKLAGEIKPHLSPLAKKLLETNQLSESDFIEFIRNYRFSKKDVVFFSEYFYRYTRLRIQDYR